MGVIPVSVTGERLPPTKPLSSKFTPAGRMPIDILYDPRRGYSFMGKTKAPATLTVPGIFAIS